MTLMHDPIKSDRFPGYDVMSKRAGPSWNDQTRRVVAERLSISSAPRFFNPEEFETVVAVAERIVPQPKTRALIPVAALVDDKLHKGKLDGYRHKGMPRDGDAWRLGLRALDTEAKAAFGERFHQLEKEKQEAMLERMQKGELKSSAWGDMPSDTFFKARLARDIVMAYYSHPVAWNEIGWGGPASPRGYVRMDFDERDPWEAAEVKDGNIDAAYRKNRRVK
jgi:hypothetical protein